MARLDEWRREIARCFDGTTPATPQGVALQPFVAAFDLPQRPLEDLVDGVAMDIGSRRYKTFGELYQYCYRVASTVGLVCVQIFGCQEADSRDYAVDLGVALQLTNILRDVAVDLERGRLYIPLDELEASGCTRRPDSTAAAVRARAGRCSRDRPSARARLLPARDPHDAAQRGAEARRRRDHVGHLPGDPREIERRDYDVFSEDGPHPAASGVR